MEQEKEERRRNWRERQQRSRARRADEEEEDELRELSKELKRAIQAGPWGSVETRGSVPRWFFAEHGIVATLEAMRFLKIAPPTSDNPTKEPAAPSRPEKGWWIDMDSKQVVTRLAETNPRVAEICSEIEPRRWRLRRASMPRYKPAADKIAQHLALKARAQAIVSQMTTRQLRKFLMGRKHVTNGGTQPQAEGNGDSK